MDIKLKTKVFLLILVAISIFVFPLLVKAITFNDNTYIEMFPAIKGTACFIDNDGNCVAGTDKDILIGMTFVYPSQEDSQRATSSVIPIVKFDGVMYRGTNVGVMNKEDPEFEPCISSCSQFQQNNPEDVEGYVSCSDSCIHTYSHYDYSTGRMSTLNPDGSEILDTAQVKYTLNAKSASLSDFSITIEDDTYKLNSIITIKKITGILSSDNFVSSDNRLTTKLTCRNLMGVSFVGAESQPDITREVDCNYNLVGPGDSQAFLDWGDGTSEEVFPSAYFIDIPKAHIYQQSGGIYDVTLKLVSPSGQETVTNTEQVTLPSV